MSDNEPKKHSDDDERFGASAAVDYILERFDLIRSTDGRNLLAPKSGGPAIDIGEVARSLSGDIYRDRGIALSKHTVGTALDVVAGMIEKASPQPVYLRASERQASLFLDLGRTDNEIALVSAHGWSLLSDDIADAKENDDERPFAPMFRRTATVRALPTPVQSRDGREKFADILNLKLTDRRFHLIWGWLVASVFSEIPRPALWFTGPQGSGKTTAGLMTLSVISPADRMGGNFAKNERDDLVYASGSFIPSWDNLTSISQNANDFLCRLVTGSENAARSLYTDETLRLSTVMRTALFSSINLPGGLREDGLERIIHVGFDRIGEGARRTEGQIRDDFREHHAEILGCLLSDVAGVLRNRAAAREALAGSMPRMADYAVILQALDMHLAIFPQYGRFLSAYRENLSVSMADRAMDDPFSAAVLQLAQGHSGEWRTTTTDLFQMLDTPTLKPADVSWWPTSPRGLGSVLRTHSESLRAIGVHLEFPEARSSSGRKLVVINYVPTDDAPIDSANADYIEMLIEDGDTESVDIFHRQTVTV